MFATHDIHKPAKVEMFNSARLTPAQKKLLVTNGWDPGVLRPYLDEHGNSWILVRDGYNPDGSPKYTQKLVANASGSINNATATLAIEEWRLIDDTVEEAARIQLRFVDDLLSRGLRKDIDGMATPAITYQRRGDITDAKISMRPLREAEKDRVEYDSVTMPIPIIHKGTSIDLRELAATRRAGRPMDTDMIGLMTRKVLEMAEQLAIGNLSFSWGGGTVYGPRNFPFRNTKVMTNPTSGTWDPTVTMTEVIDMRQTARNDFRSGPYRMYYSTDWDPYLDQDYSSAYPGVTLRSRISQIASIESWVPLEILTGFQMLLIQMTSDVIRMIVGMPVRAIEWTSGDGFEHFITIMTILVPWLRVDQANNCGIVHGTAP